jgi:heat shock protein HslJ
MEIGPLTATEMACDHARMAVEAKVMAALSEVRSFAVGPDGGLYLRRQDGAVVMCLG